MAKFVLTTAVLLIVAATAIVAAPAEGEFEDLEFSQGAEPFNDEEVERQDTHLRFRRVTCDLLSFKGVVGDSACAANCLSMGKAGGRCNNGVCQCRKTNFGDLWKKRFG